MEIIPQNNYAQKLYDYGAGTGRDKEVSSAILNTIADLIHNPNHIPTGSDILPVETDHKADAKKSLKEVKLLYQKQAPLSTSLVLLGEDHTDQEDHDRALYFIAEIDAGNLTPDLVVFERGMTYPAPAGVIVIRETNLTTVAGGDFGMGLSAKQRSMVVGGYLTLIVASGNQLDINKF